jgi:hypothetical protein
MEQDQRNSNVPSDQGHGTVTYQTHNGWHAPEPATLLRPTYWPVIVAIGIIFLLWGIVANPMISAVGFGIFVVGVAGWIGEVRDER